GGAESDSGVAVRVRQSATLSAPPERAVRPARLALVMACSHAEVVVEIALHREVVRMQRRRHACRPTLDGIGGADGALQGFVNALAGEWIEGHGRIADGQP